MGALPSVSVIVPAHNAEAMLADTLPAIRRACTSDVEWELLVVDDGSSDRTADVASRHADRVVRLPAPPGGPARARNAGASVARGDCLLFVDADIMLHTDALERLVHSLTEHPEAVAAFGSYDANPVAKGTVSQFRNLLHHYVHSRSPGPAETFWAGLGIVRRDAFQAAGAFDAERYARPQMEDIELGYRLREGGGSILLDPGAQGTHLKSWTLLSMVRTDFLDRGIPWTRLLLERQGRSRGTLAAGRVEAWRMVLAVLAVLALLVWLLGDVVPSRVVFLLAAAAHLALCLPVYLWFARMRGPLFALASVALLTTYYLVAAAAGAAGLCLYVGHRLSRAE